MHVTFHGAEAQEMTARGILDLIAPEDSSTAALLGVGASVGVLLPFSREHELEADRLGVRYAAKAGYRPKAAIDLWTRMSKAKRGTQPIEFLSTQPADDARIAALRAEVAQLNKDLM
jgi:predicted Zn-dependent protease